MDKRSTSGMADIIDFTFPEPVMHSPDTYSCTPPFWDAFYEESVHRIFADGGYILDVGSGLRIDANRGNTVNKSNQKRFTKYLSDPNVEYVVSDYTDTYTPNRIEDIHQLTYDDNTIDGIFCIALLEHVYDPKKAAEEICRVLKPGGKAFVYVPFIYRYHANTTKDYRDYFRYSKDGIAYLFRDCSSVTICPVRGIFESLLRFTPMHTWPLLAPILRCIDWKIPAIRAISQKQTSGYFVSIEK